MRRLFLLTGLAAAALALSGCIRDPDPFTIDDERVSIHFILEAGAVRVLALITLPADIGTGVPVTDAAVRLIHGTDTVALSFEPGGDGNQLCAEFWPPWPGGGGCHRADLAEPIQPGETYDLEVVLANDARITGRTTVPLPVTLTAPAEGERLVADCNDPTYCFGLSTDVFPYTLPVTEVVFRWTTPVDRARIGLGARPIRVFHQGEEYPGGTCGLGYYLNRITADSAALPIPNIGCGDPLVHARFDSIQAEAVVYLRNGEFARYLDVIGEGQTARAASVAEGLEGPAWGVFGAIAEARRTVMILRDPAPD